MYMADGDFGFNIANGLKGNPIFRFTVNACVGYAELMMSEARALYLSGIITTQRDNISEYLGGISSFTNGH